MTFELHNGCAAALDELAACNDLAGFNQLAGFHELAAHHGAAHPAVAPRADEERAARSHNGADAEDGASAAPRAAALPAALQELLKPSPAALERRLALRLWVIDRVREQALELDDPLAALNRMAVADLQERSARAGMAADLRCLHGATFRPSSDDPFERVQAAAPLWKLALDVDRQSERLMRLCGERRRAAQPRRDDANAHASERGRAPLSATGGATPGDECGAERLDLFASVAAARVAASPSPLPRGERLMQGRQPIGGISRVKTRSRPRRK